MATGLAVTALSAADNVAEMKSRAERGDAEAANYLGWKYHTGDGVARDYSAAVDWYRRAAARGLADAQFNLGLCYDRGIGVGADPIQAAIWYRKAAEQGTPQAQAALGACHLRGSGVPKDTAEAARWLRLAAAQNHAHACYLLSRLHTRGEGVPRDHAAAVGLLRRAAEHGHAEAQHEFGQRCFEGNGVVRDQTEGLKWLHKAAESGSADAQYALGQKYRTGAGVPQDPEAGLGWLNRAAGQGHADAKAYLENIAAAARQKRLVPLAELWRRAEAQDSALAEIRRQAAAGVADAQFEMGVRSFRLMAEDFNAVAAWNVANKGSHQDRDPTEPATAADWFRKAAEQGHVSGQMALANCYELGRGVPRNPQAAIAWFERAAEGGDSHAHYRLARIRDGGVRDMFLKPGAPRDADGVRDYAAATEHYKRFVTRRTDDILEITFALRALVETYSKGREGVPKDIVEAAKWLRVLAERGDSAACRDLGKMYHYGRSEQARVTLPYGSAFDRDPPQAYMWYVFGGRQPNGGDDAEGCRNFAKLVAKRLTPEERAAAEAEVDALIERQKQRKASEAK